MKGHRLAAGSAAAALVGGALVIAAPNATAATIKVHAGQSIQAAVNAAHPGDTIRIGPGVYDEAVTVGTSNLTIVGNRTIIEPPTPVANWGLCVANNPSNCTSSGPLVKNVTISGITVRGEHTWGFGVFGASGVTFSNDTALNSGTGFAVKSSAFVSVVQSSAAGDGSGVQDDSSFDTTVTGLVARGNSYGAVVDLADGFTVRQSIMQSNCAGLVITAGAGQNAPVTVTGDAFTNNNSSCSEIPGLIPAIDGAGVVIVASDNVALSGNAFQANGQPHAAGPNAGGLVVTATGALAGNHFTNNAFSANAPYDIVTDDVLPADNRFANNACRTSKPAGLCP